MAAVVLPKSESCVRVTAFGSVRNRQQHRGVAVDSGSFGALYSTTSLRDIVNFLFAGGCLGV